MSGRETARSEKVIEQGISQTPILGDESVPSVNLFWAIPWVLFRVSFVLVVWLLLFVLVFLGFFTIPLLFVVSLILGYALHRLYTNLARLLDLRRKGSSEQ